MFQLDLKDRRSIYEQIIDGFKGMIARGELSPGDRLPSVRELSTKLTVNPNTIQKSYSALEAQGWIYTVAGRGCFVSEQRPGADEKQLTAAFAKLNEVLRELAYVGADLKDVVSRAEAVFAQKGKDAADIGPGGDFERGERK